MTTISYKSACLSRAFVISALLLALGGVVQADTPETIWQSTTPTGNAWNGSSNWGTNGAPSSGVSAEFRGTFSAQPTLTAAGTSEGIWVTGTGNTGVSGLTDISGAFGLTITGNATLDSIANAGILLDGTGNNSLTIDSTVTGVANTNSTSFIVNNTGTLTIGAPMTIGTGTTLTLGSTTSSGAGKIVINGNIGTSNGKVVINDTAGTTSVTLNGSNSYTGTTTVSAGTLILTNTAALSSSSFTVGGTASPANGRQLLSS